MTRQLTAGPGVGPRAWRSGGLSDHADTQLVGHSWHARSVDLSVGEVPAWTAPTTRLRSARLDAHASFCTELS
jgi:hypothetical protein